MTRYNEDDIRSYVHAVNRYCSELGINHRYSYTNYGAGYIITFVDSDNCEHTASMFDRGPKACVNYMRSVCDLLYSLWSEKRGY